MFHKRMFVGLLTALLLVVHRGAHAELVITNLALDDHSLSFELSGTIDIPNYDDLTQPAVVGNWQARNNLFIGQLGVLDWYTGASQVTATWTGTTGFLTTSNTFAAVSEINGFGSYAYLGTINTPIPNGAAISGTFEMTSATPIFASGHAGLDLSQWIVSVGYVISPLPSSLPDPRTQTGSVAPVPEPGTFAALCLGMVLVCARRRRRPLAG